MGLEKRVYSVLVVSAAESVNKILLSLLSESKYGPVHMVTNVSAAKRELADRSFDYVIINSPLPDDVGTRFAIDASEARGTVVLLLTRAEIYAEIYERVTGYGVFLLPKPTSRSILVTALSWMLSAREKLRRTEKKTLSVEEKMEEIRIVNRAKWILISELKMSEADAHRYIEKQAMDQSASKRQIAEGIIKTYS